jgi:hypothetical protein
MTYRDQFGNDHTKRFGWIGQFVSGDEPFFHMEGDNSEDDWGEKQGQLKDQP